MPKLPLKYFILSSQSKTLYRQFWKVIVKIPDSITREDVGNQVRS